ncbi:hypothetical protein BCR42DRAFT_469838 [Absidia repens]|uniref:Palmitoyltransferase n=1 Tax=Absidia repens TaxID=90262 RepID=A0A1X2I6I9_9FUNG|nr:hypothetical protein BCR42DRAFT_469838 [Absidia repens]
MAINSLTILIFYYNGLPLFLLTFFFYYVLIHFATVFQEQYLDATWNLVKEWPEAMEQDFSSSSWLWATHARQISFFIYMSIFHALSFIDTEDPAFKASQDHRSKIYVKSHDISVIDPFTSVCGISLIKLAKSTAHCKLCNKCLGGMDHHCKWLNCCTGLEIIVIQMLNLIQDKNPLETMTQKYYLFMAIACFVAIFAVTALLATTWLLGFHIRLVYQSTLDDDDSTDTDDEEDGYFDDSNRIYDQEQDLDDETDDKFWRRSWRTNMSGSLKQEGHVIGVLIARIHKTLRRLTGSVGQQYGLLVSNDDDDSGSTSDGFRTGKLFYWYEKCSTVDDDNENTDQQRGADKMVTTHRNDRIHSEMQNGINFKEMLPTKTTRPMMTTLNNDRSYDTDMGLDIGHKYLGSKLNDYRSTSRISATDTSYHLLKCRSVFSSPPSSFKTAQILDRSDTEVKMHLSLCIQDTISID